MTIMFCDIMLAVLKREMAYHNNIEMKLINMADILRDDKIVNVYHRVLPGYELTNVQPENTRIILEKPQNIKHLNFKIYEDIYYLFPLETRKEDIEYYEILRQTKLENLDVNKIMEQQNIN